MKLKYATSVVVTAEVLVIFADAYLGKSRRVYVSLHRVTWWRYGHSLVAAMALTLLGLLVFDRDSDVLNAILTGILIPVSFADALSRIISLGIDNRALGFTVCTACFAGAVLMAAWWPV